eukprot:403344807
MERGIIGTAADIQERVQRYGSNKSKSQEIKSIWKIIYENFANSTIIILCIISSISLTIELILEDDYGWINGAFIIAAALTISTITVINQYKDQKSLSMLAILSAREEQIVVYRGEDRTEMQIGISELVVGDLILLQAEMKVPVDCIIVEGSILQCDESQITGSTDLAPKTLLTEESFEQNPNPFVWAQSFLKSGQALAIVCAVGEHTNIAQQQVIAAQEKEQEQSPLDEKLEETSNSLANAALFFSIFVFVGFITKFIIVTLSEDDGDLWTAAFAIEFLDQICFAMSIYVLISPGGMPIGVAISISNSVKKMLKGGSLLRNLAAFEYLGEIQELIIDKTGILTQNKISVAELYLNDTIYQSQPSDLGILPNNKKLAEAVLYTFTQNGEEDLSGKILETERSTIDQGMINYLSDVGYGPFPTNQELDQCILQKIVKGRVTVAIRHPTIDNLVRIYVKGSPENVIGICQSFFDKNGEQQELGQEQKDILEAMVEKNGCRLLRSVLFASADLTVEEYESLKLANNDFQSEQDKQALESNLTLVGGYALRDFLRCESMSSISQSRKAGINVRVVTGDNLQLAKIIAQECGIITQEEAEEEYVCMEGKQFRDICGGLVRQPHATEEGKFSEEIANQGMFRVIKDKLKILARATPEDKYMLVTGLQQGQDSIVAVTGDSKSDAPILQKADVGFALGMYSSDEAKQSADVILMNDIQGIVQAVRWGRNTQENVRKLLQFQLTVNFTIMIVLVVSGFFKNDAPFTTVQVIWINLVMDLCACIAFAYEPPSAEILDRKPFTRDDILITPVMSRNIIGQGLLQGTILLVMLLAGNSIFGFEYDDDISFYYDVDGVEMMNYFKIQHYTLIFHTFILMQIFNQINCRKLGEFDYNVFKNFSRSPLFILMISLAIIIQCLLVQFGGRVMTTVPLTIYQQLVCFGIGFFQLFQNMIVKIVLPARWFASHQEKKQPVREELQQLL